MYKGRTRFSAAPWIRATIAAVAVGSSGVAVFLYSQDGVSWISGFFIAFSIICIAGVIESFSMFIALDDDQIRFRGSFRKTVIPKSDIESVTWEAGCGVSLRLKNGRWESVPDLGINSQGLVNSVRSWLKTS